MSNAAAAEVEACRNELLQLKSIVQRIQNDYKSTAHQRVAYQQKMARMVQTIQERCTDDTPLVEDVIIVSLQSETSANQSRTDIPSAPVIDPNNQPSGRTASAEEAMAVYKNQIATLTQDRAYREALLQSETTMVKIYNGGIRDIVAIMKEYCPNPSLVKQIEQIAASM